MKHFLLIGVAGMLIGQAVAQTNVTTPGGTTNVVPKFTAGSEVGDSAMSESSGNVGIGTTSPAAHLHIVGSDFSNMLRVGSGTPVGGYYLNLSTNVLTPGVMSYVFNIHNNGQDYPSVLSLSGDNGRVGIGTTNPWDILKLLLQQAVFIVLGKNIDANQFGAGNWDRYKGGSALLTGWNRTAGAGESDLIASRPLSLEGGFGFWDLNSEGIVAPLVRIKGDTGNMGIGTFSPSERLEVSGNIKLSGNGAHLSFPDDSIQSTAWNGTTCGGDYAESVDVTGERSRYEPGDVLVIDPKAKGKFVKSAKPYSTMVMGIFSTKPGLTGRRQATPKNEDEVPMAMMGIVPTKVSTENGPIEPGDLLVTSSTPGYAMKGTDRSLMLGAVVGKALEGLVAGKGVIEVGVTLQ